MTLSQLDAFHLMLNSGLTEIIELKKYLVRSANLLRRHGTHVEFNGLVKIFNVSKRDAEREFHQLQRQQILMLMMIVTITAGDPLGATRTIALDRRHPTHSSLANGQTRVGTATLTLAINTSMTLTQATVRQPPVRGILVVCKVKCVVAVLGMHVKLVSNEKLVKLVIKLAALVHEALVTNGNMTHSEFG